MCLFNPFISGYIGFTTGTNDAYAVVKEYIKRQPKASIGRYLPALQDLTKYDFGDPKRDDTSHLKGFVKAWKKTTCHDPVFIQTQLDMGHSMYLQPALKYAASVGIHSNLGKAIFYGNNFICHKKIRLSYYMLIDTIVQHGWQVIINYPSLYVKHLHVFISMLRNTSIFQGCSNSQALKEKVRLKQPI